MTILVFGDIMGRIGRRGLATVLPAWREAHRPDFVIANVENLSHGTGITPQTMAELDALGVDAFTSGNHVFDKDIGLEVFRDPRFRDRLIRPANYPNGTPGGGWAVIEKHGQRIGLLNLIGRVFFPTGYDCPFRTTAELLKLPELQGLPVLVDFHADATSEKNTFMHYLDGRVAAVWGTHSHVPTADERMLPKGTAAITDVGMTGGMHGSIGAKLEPVLQTFLTARKQKIEPIELGPCEVNAIVLEINPETPTTIRRLRTIVEIG